MKKISISLLILTLAFTPWMISAPGYAAAEKVILQIEGMT